MGVLRVRLVMAGGLAPACNVTLAANS